MRESPLFYAALRNLFGRGFSSVRRLRCGIREVMRDARCDELAHIDLNEMLPRVLYVHKVVVSAWHFRYRGCIQRYPCEVGWVTTHA